MSPAETIRRTAASNAQRDLAAGEFAESTIPENGIELAERMPATQTTIGNYLQIAIRQWARCVVTAARNFTYLERFKAFKTSLQDRVFRTERASRPARRATSMPQRM